MTQSSHLSAAKLLYDRKLPYSAIAATYNVICQASIQEMFICYHRNIASNEINWDTKGATRVSFYHALKSVGCKRDRK